LGLKSALLNIYDKKYKKLMIISLLLVILSIGYLGYNYATTGELFKKGVSLKGGITLTIPVQEKQNLKQIEKTIKNQLPKADLTIRELTEAGKPKAIIIEASDTTPDELIKATKKTSLTVEKGNYNIENMGSTLGQSFFKQTTKSIIIAFILMSIVVFITFRALVPSLFVILAAVSDIISTIAAADFLGIKMSTAGIAALLMLIGYSVDTDILLTTKVLKRRKEGGSLFERTIKAAKTGLTMSLTSLAAAAISLIFAQSNTLKQIMLIIVIGLLFDIVYTWIQNAGILRLYMEKKHGTH